MEIKCEKKFLLPSSEVEIVEQNLGGLILSIDISSRNRPIRGVEVFYDRYYNQNIILGETDKTGTMKTQDYSYEYHEEDVSIADNLNVNKMLDADPLEYFIVYENDIQNYRGLDLLLKYKNSSYRVRIGNFQIDSAGNEVDLAEINAAKIYLEFNRTNDEFKVNKIDVLSSIDKSTSVGQSFNQTEYNLNTGNMNEMSICDESIKMFKNSIRRCKWSLAKKHAGRIFTECGISRDRELLMEISTCYFWDQVVDYDDENFLDDLNYSNDDINLFEAMDAIYKQTDNIINFTKTDFSNTELARHYHKKFYFYYSYLEMLYVNQYKIKSSDSFRYPRVYSLIDAGDGIRFKDSNWKQKQINKYLSEQAIDTKDKFNFYKNKAATMNEGIDVDYLKITQEKSDRLDIIRKSTGMK